MKRKAVIVIALALAGVLIVSSILVYELTSRPETPPQIDNSWIPTVEQLLQDAQPYPPDNSSVNVADNPQDITIYLTENDSQQLIYYGSGNNFTTYLTGLMENVSYEKVARVSEVYLGEVMQNDKVVTLNYNIATVIADHPNQRFYEAYFVLQDNQNMGLTGAIFVRSTQPLRDGHLGMWFITK